MITRVSTIQESGNEVLTLAMVKDHLRVSGNSEDSLITLYLQSAQLAAESRTGRAIGLQKLTAFLNCFDAVEINASTNDAVEKIEYYAPGDSELTELDPALYTFLPKSVFEGVIESYCLAFAGELPEIDTDRDDAVKVTVSRGYGGVDCPVQIKSAMLLMIGDLYERREDRGEIGYNSAADNLLRPFRKW